MTTDDDVALHELWDSCPDPDRYAHYDYESPGAEMQSVVLGNLFAMIGVTDASGRSRSMDDADLSTLAVAQRTPPPVVAGDPLLGDVTLDLQEFFAEHIDGERPVANAVRLSGQKVRVTLEDGRRFDVTVSRVV